MDSLLDIRNLCIDFRRGEGFVRAAEGVNLCISRGRTVALVGESGCGKSVTAMSILGLLPLDRSKVQGEILFEGENLLGKPEHELQKIRGKSIAMIFQEPMTALNPLFTIGNQVAEMFVVHERLPQKEAKARAIDMLHRVAIPSPGTRYNDYPHQLSGGMRQRVMIAMALACSPKLLIADEPTTALDVTVQAQILELLAKLQKEIDMSVLLITHDLGVVAEFCKDIYVMYAGEIVEKNSAKNLFQTPSHPYTRALLESIPRIDRREKRLSTIAGMVPSLGAWDGLCRFRPRCTLADAGCLARKPEWSESGVRCLKARPSKNSGSLA